MNEVGPTIQQGVVQRPVQQKPQSMITDAPQPDLLLQGQVLDRGNFMVNMEQRDRLPRNEGFPNPSDHVTNSNVKHSH